MKYFITIALIISTLPVIHAQSESQIREWNKNEKKYLKGQLKRGKSLFNSKDTLYQFESRRLKEDISAIYFVTDVVLTQCDTSYLCHSLFAKGMLTGEVFYKELNTNPSNFNKDVWTTENGDTVKNHMWNDGRGSLYILYFEHLSQLDKKHFRYFCIWTSMATHLTGGHHVSYIVLYNESADKKTELKDFIRNSTHYRLYSSHGEI